MCALRARRFGEVLERLAEVEAEAGRQHDWRLLSQAHNVAGEAHAGRRDWPAAERAYATSLELAWNALARSSFAFALWNLPVALAHQREPAAAAEVAGAAEHFWTAHMGGLHADDRRDLRRVRRLVVVQIGAAATTRRWQAGREMPVAEVVDRVLKRKAL